MIIGVHVGLGGDDEIDTVVRTRHRIGGGAQGQLGRTRFAVSCCAGKRKETTACRRGKSGPRPGGRRFRDHRVTPRP